MTSPTPNGRSIFEEPLWLDAVSPNRWAEVSVRDAQNRVVAHLPFETRRRYGLTILQNPVLSPYVGPFGMADDGAHVATRIGRELRYAQELAATLPRHEIAMLTLSPGNNAWVGFKWNGFRARPGLTYRLRLDVPVDVLWKNIRSKLRRDIKAASQHVVVHDELAPDALEKQVFERLRSKQVGHLFDAKLFSRATAAAQSAGCPVWTLIARDERGEAHGGAFFVGDAQCIYYLAGGVQPGLPGSVGALLAWEGIQRALGTVPWFDFEGSTVPGVEHLFRGFGGEQQVVIQVLRLGAKLAPLERLLRTRVLGQWPSTAQGSKVPGAR